MKPWKIIVIPLLITLAIGAIYLFSVFEHRQDPGVTAQKDATEDVNKDELVVMRSYFPAHYEDTLRLQGTTVWMKNGYTIPYFSYKSGQV